jgi:hypothetical protein
MEILFQYSTSRVNSVDATFKRYVFTIYKHGINTHRPLQFL